MSEITIYVQLTLSQEDSPASLIPLPGSAEAQTMTVISGRKCAALLASSGPVGSLLRMCLASARLSSTRCYLTWKLKATPAGRLIFRLSPSMPGTDASASLLLPTATAIDAGTGRMNQSDSPNAAERPTLAMMARRDLWPTLTEAAADGGQTSRSGDRKNELLLGGMMRTMPTLTAQDATGRKWQYGNKARTKRTLTLAGRILPTLKSRDYRSGSHLDSDRMQKKSNGTWHSPDLNNVIAPGGSLNPTWLEWFMGVPTGWTELEDSATP